MEKTRNNRGPYINCSSSEDIHFALKNAVESSVFNIGLYIDKFVEWKEEGNERKCSPKTQIKKLKEICNVEEERLSIPARLFPLELYKKYMKRRSSLFSDLKASGYKIVSSKKDIFWRLIMSHGAASVYETSLLLHRNYSIPFISGSSIKGVTHNYVIQEKIEDDDINKIFGNEKQKGLVNFFDAFPIIEDKKDFLVLDIMNVHYQEYYQGEKKLGDWMAPNPVFFLALENMKFEFTIASKNTDSGLAEKASKLLDKALSVEGIGIGSKTSVGYGYFSEE